VVRAAGLRPIDAGRLNSARLLERLTAFQVELSQRYDLDYVSRYDARVVERVRLAA
jgi:predicted dinucleotide-binding enzyme